MTIELKGASGGSVVSPGGAGGCLTVVITPTPGQVMYINVGGQGSVTAGGFNGGGPGGVGLNASGAGGGGASDVRIGSNALADRRFVAAGGGGAGTVGLVNLNTSGGAGGVYSVNCMPMIGAGGAPGTGSLAGIAGGCAGGTGNQTGGGGGVTSAGGPASWLLGYGSFGAAGSLGTGGGGGDYAGTYGGSGGTLGGGGGGGGYYGGGGGMAMTGPPMGCGGGGGSSYLDNTLTNSYAFGSNWQGHGWVQLTYSSLGSAISVSSPSLATCNSASTSLNASGAVSYTWLPSGNFGGSSSSSVVVSPSVTTSYTVTGTNAQGCISQSIVTVQTYTSLPIPVLSVSPGLAMCPGTPLSFTVSDQAATPVTTFSWSTGVTGPAVTNTAFAGGGIYTVSASASNACGTSSTGIQVTVNPGPALTVTAVPPVICSGQTASLTVSGANSYTWAGSNQTATLIPVNPSQSTSYIVTGSLGACTASASIQLTVNPSPTISVAASSIVICLNSSGTITASGASSYTWLAVNNFTGANNTSSVVITPTTTASYTVLGTSAQGCLSQSMITIQVISAAPTLTFNSPVSQTVCPNTPVTLSASGAYSVAWTGGISNNVPFTPPEGPSAYIASVFDGFCFSYMQAAFVTVARLAVSASASPASICQGGTTTLTAVSAANGYTWQPATQNTSVVAVSPPASIIYTVSVSNGTPNCDNSATVAVNVIPGPTVSIGGQSVICNGQSAILMTSGANSYTWSANNQNGNIISVSPSQNTVYTVTGAGANNCLGTASLQVIVNPTPTVSISSSTLICMGGSIAIVASGADSYTWSTASTMATITPVLSSPMSFSVVGSYTATNCFSTQSLNISVYNPSITIAPSSTAICAGGQASLSAFGATPGTYTWTGGFNSPGIGVSPLVTTIYTVSASSSSNNVSCPVSGTATVFVNPLPTVSISPVNPQICAGDPALTLTASGASSYSWNTTATTFSIGVSPLATTVYLATGTNSNGCVSQASVQLVVNPLPVLQIITSRTVMCQGDGPVSIQVSGASSYTWSTVSTATVIAVAPLTNTVYSVTGINTSGCQAQASVSIVVAACTGINDHLMNAKLPGIYPNPNNGIFTIYAEADCSLLIINGLGQEVKSFDLNHLNGYTMEISGLAEGVYFIQDRNGRAQVQKILVSK